MLYFRIGKGCLAYRTPVDDPGTFVDISFFIKAYEHFLYSPAASFVHREPLSVPVTGYAKFL